MDGFTIFAPKDEAVLNFYRKHKYSYRKKRNYVKGHVYKGHLKLSNIHDGRNYFLRQILKVNYGLLICAKYYFAQQNVRLHVKCETNSKTNDKLIKSQ